VAKKKILIAEDSPDLAYLLELTLKGDEFEITSVKDGFEAVRAARKVLPDIILLDIMLPRQDGLQVCRLLKYDKAFRTVPIIVMTSMASPEVEEDAKKAGADVFMRKPFAATDLLDKVRALLGN
jgi:DNA-binding response OmpR family regulator